MKKRIAKHIENKDYVKVYITDNDDLIITHFEGFIFDQSEKFLFMNDMTDFTYDGLIILKKSDISEIKYTGNEKFIKYILDSEKITESIFEKREKIQLSLKNLKTIFSQLKSFQIPIIIECKYGKDDRFQIGPITEVDDKKVKIKYFNSRGEYDLKPVSAKYKDITFIRVDSPYANTYYKYVKDVE